MKEASQPRRQPLSMVNVANTGWNSLLYLLAIVIGVVIRAHELTRQALLDKSSFVWVDDPPPPKFYPAIDCK